MKLNYDKERWEEIPEEVKEMETAELDFTLHGDREYHKMELDRRLWWMSRFLREYKWNGERRNTDSNLEEDDLQGQAGLGIFS